MFFIIKEFRNQFCLVIFNLINYKIILTTSKNLCRYYYHFDICIILYFSVYSYTYVYSVYIITSLLSHYHN